MLPLRWFPILPLTLPVLLTAPRANAAWEAASDASGAVEIRDGGKSVARFVPKTAPERRGPAAVRAVSVSGHRVVEVRLPILGDGPSRQEVWIAELPAQSVIWWEEAGARDVDGETARDVIVSESGIEEFQTASRLYRCDGVAAHLFSRVWSFSAHHFRPASPALPPAAPIAIKARRGDAQMPTGKPFGGFHFHSASSSAGADGDARKLSSPIALNDDDPATVWSAETGDARGTFLTARSSAGFAITGLRILPGDTRSPQAFEAASRPRRLSLLLGRGAEQSLDVDLVESSEGGAKHFREPFWIPLPKPVSSGCVTVMIRDVTRGRAATAIADVSVMTDVDGPQAVDRIVADLGAGTSCEARLPLLTAVGSPALEKVTEALARTPAGAGRVCLVEAMNALLTAAQPASNKSLAAPGAAASALAAALRSASPDEEKLLFSLLPRLQDPPVPAVIALLADEAGADADRLRAAQVLAFIARPEARQGLLAALGKGTLGLRAGLRKIAASTPPPLAGDALAALAATPDSAHPRRADLIFVLAATAAREPDQVKAAMSVLRATLQAQSGFEEKARALAGLGMIRSAAAIAELTAFRASAKDGVLRFLATRELAGMVEPEAQVPLRAALQDDDPRAREAAALGLGLHAYKPAAQELIAAAKQEPWPFVRRAELTALGGLCVPEGNELLLRAYEKDIDDNRMAALVGLAHCRDHRASALLVRVLGRLPESADMRSLAARLLAEMKDPRTIAPMAEVLKRLRTESQADLSLEGTATETVMALASLGGKHAVAAAVDLLTDSRASLQKSAVEALSMLCDPGPGAAALRSAALSKDDAVSAAASAAAKRCAGPAPKRE